MLFVNICSIGSWPNIWIADLISARSNHPRHFDVCLSSCPLLCLLSLLSPSLKLIHLSVLPGRFYPRRCIHSRRQYSYKQQVPCIKSEVWFSAPCPSSLPHSYLSFHSSVSHFTYMFMQNYASDLLDTSLQRLSQIKRIQQHQIFEWPGFAIWIYPAVELWPARLAHLETGRIVRATLNEVPLQPRQGAPLIKLVGKIPYPIPILIPPLTFC